MTFVSRNEILMGNFLYTKQNHQTGVVPGRKFSQVRQEMNLMSSSTISLMNIGDWAA